MRKEKSRTVVLCVASTESCNSSYFRGDRKDSWKYEIYFEAQQFTLWKNPCWLKKTITFTKPTDFSGEVQIP